MDIVFTIAGILLVALGVAVSIGLHELGHFLPARRFGVFVGKFMIGFGPTVWSRKFGETEFGVKAIPLGGFVSLSGMYPPTANTTRRGFALFRTLIQEARDASAETIVDDNRAFYRLAVWKRVIIMLGGPLANLLIAVVLYLALFCGVGTVSITTTVDHVSPCVTATNAVGDACTASDPISPAHSAGFKAGDRIVSINGVPITAWDSSMDIIRRSAGIPLTIVVNRDGHDVTLTPTPIPAQRFVTDASGALVRDANGKPTTTTVGFIGISPTTTRLQRSPSDAMVAMGSNVAEVGALILEMPNRMVEVWQSSFGDAPRDANGPISVVGVGRIAGEIAGAHQIDLGDRVAFLIGMVASLNIALFVFNLIPLLPLDGGHIAIAAVEGIRRRIYRFRGLPSPAPFDTARLVPVTAVMTVILIGMSMLLIYADIVKPITLGP